MNDLTILLERFNYRGPNIADILVLKSIMARVYLCINKIHQSVLDKYPKGKVVWYRSTFSRKLSFELGRSNILMFTTRL